MLTTQNASRIIYPQIPDPITKTVLQTLFTPTHDEKRWATTTVRSVSYQVALLTQLKLFQILGRFVPFPHIPPSVVKHISTCLGCPDAGALHYSKNTFYRHQVAVRNKLGVAPWGPQARQLAESTVASIAESRTDPAELINAAVNALIKEHFELPAIDTLRRIAGTAHRSVNSAQWRGIYDSLSEKQIQTLDALLDVKEKEESAFATLCRGAGKATRENLKLLLSHYEWLQILPDPAGPLASIADTKVLQWANEAKRLKAAELREYVAPRRVALLLSTIRAARGLVLDDMTNMLLKFARRIEWKSEHRLEAWYANRRAQTDTLILAFRDSLAIHATNDDPALKLAALDTLFASHGGLAQLQEECSERLLHQHKNWRPFARQAFMPYRSVLFHLANNLPLKGTKAASNLLEAICIVAEVENRSSYLTTNCVIDYLPRDWRRLIYDNAEDEEAKCLNLKQLEVATILELAEAIKGGDVYVPGSLSHDQFWNRLPPQISDRAAAVAYAAEHGFRPGANGFVDQLRESLRREAHALDSSVHEFGAVSLGKDGRPIVSPIQRVEPPPSAIELERALLDRMPERSVLCALANTQHWTGWDRHFGLPSRLNPQIKDAANRYILTAFTYGCGLGATQAARHFTGNVSADHLRFVDRRHIDIDDLRAASTDLMNLYAQFELPKHWGSGESAAADGTHFQTYEENLLAEHHIRYGKTGGIAYRHISNNYIALFSQFIACGTYEATFILDALQMNLSDIRPRRIHADTHGQSVAVFGLAYLLGIDLMPRIRNWRNLKLYQPDRSPYYKAIGRIFNGQVDWDLIRSHYDDFMRIAIAIQSGTMAPSAVLARLNSYSRRNQFSRALQELGRVVRTIFLLRWIGDEPLRRDVHKGTTKVERHHNFTKFLYFGGGGLLRTNDPEDQEKAIVYNELVANAVALQNVVDQTQALHQLQAEGVSIDPRDLSFMSPYNISKSKRFGDYPTKFSPEPLAADTMT